MKIRYGVPALVMALSMQCRVIESKTPETGEAVMEGTTAATALFAGGCFWCMEGPFEAEEGVHEVRSGYTGGRSADPSYGEVSSGRTGHREAIEVRYDPRKIGYERLLDIFWRQIDPTDPGGQFADRGEQYTTAVFYADETQRELALASKKELEQSGKFDKPVVTDILPAGPFYPAEEYHQDYYTKNPGHYYRYRLGSGRAGFLDSVWGDDPLPPASTEWRGDAFVKPPRDSLKKSLSRLQFRVTQNNGTEPAFNNEFWDNHEQGIYVDIVSGEPLFASVHKFESGTGWPSFRRPLVDSHVVERSDRSFGMVRTEVRSRFADSHLGHLFDDGPPPTGLRYCINSAALRFVPKEKLREEGYGRYVALFE